MIFETERLRVRRATVADAVLLYALWTDPAVMTNVGFPQGLRVTRPEIEAQIRGQDDTPFDKYLIVVLKETGEAIGECKLGSPNDEGIAHTDVKLLPAFWGQRYGVEVKQGLVDTLFAHTDCVAVEATPNVNNVASIKMQEAVGGVRVGKGVFEFPEEMQAYTTPVPHYVYRVYRPGHEPS